MALSESLEYWWTRWFVVRYSWSDWWTWLIGATWQEAVGKLAIGLVLLVLAFWCGIRFATWRKGKP